jgi:GGDEF domain-containing protein
MLLVALVLARRRLDRRHRAAAAVVAELTSTLRRARADAAAARKGAKRAREAEQRAETELRWLRRLSAVGATVDLDAVVERALEAAVRVANAAAAMIVVAHDPDDDPLLATFGLSAQESSRDLVGLSLDGGEARAVSLAYRYGDEEVESDEFRLRRGLALPVADEQGKRIGTLALFWRRVEHEVSDDELAAVEALAAALAPALRNAFRFEELRGRIELDPLTGLRGAQALHGVLARECDHARRYERRLTLLLFRVTLPVTASLLATVGERLRGAVRSSDLACHAGGGTFAVVLPESSLADAEHLLQRLQFAVGSKLADGERGAHLAAAIAELRPQDDARCLFDRADAALARAREEPHVAEPGATIAPGSSPS